MAWKGTSPKRWAAKTERKIDTALREVAIVMFRKIVLRSPVDTGRFRGNWQVAIGSVPSGTLELEDASGTATIATATATALQLKAGDVITLANNLPYAQRLEDGYSGQAPSGMVGLTVQQFQQVVRQVGAELVIL